VREANERDLVRSLMKIAYDDGGFSGAGCSGRDSNAIRAC